MLLCVPRLARGQGEGASAPEHAAPAAPASPGDEPGAAPEQAEAEALPDPASGAEPALQPTAPLGEPEPGLEAAQQGDAGEAPSAESAEPARRFTAARAGSFELAAEGDSNLARVVPSDEISPDQAAVLRVGAALGWSLAWAGGDRLYLAGTAGARLAPWSEVILEDLAHANLDVQWTRPARQGALRAGLRLSGRDVLSLHGVDGDRTYRLASGELVLVLFGERAQISVAVGPRGFQYKERGSLSWLGGGANLRLDLPLRPATEEDERSLELFAVTAAELRAYFGDASTNACVMGEALSEGCIGSTPRRRGDQVLRAVLGLRYTGEVVASVEAQLTALDSNSFSQSWQGARLRTTLTAPLAIGYASLTATMSAERYPDGLLVRLDASTYESLQADDRSSLELRLARRLDKYTELELRVATWLDLFRDTSYRRTLVSVGLVWGR